MGLRQKSHLNFLISLLMMMRISAVLYFQSMLIGQICMETAYTFRITKHHQVNTNRIICLRMYSRSVSVKRKTALLYFNAEIARITTMSAAFYQHRQRLNAQRA